MQMNLIVKMLIFFMQFGSNIATGPIRRIIGGQQAPITKFPFLVSIQMFGQHSCGGSIVAPSFVVSAAHCFGMTRDPKVFKIRAGSGYRNYSGKLVPVQRITLHKDYVVSNSDRSNDISLLKLFQSLLYSNRIKAIAIIDPNTDVKDDTEVTVSGWGDIAYSSKIVETNVLMTATFETINFNLCKKNYAAINYKVTLKMLCAGKITGGKDSCHGDSGIYNKSKFISLLIGCSVGGPLTMQTNGAPVLIGVVSFGKDCAKENFPGVYTKISVYNKWIKSRLN